MLCSAMFLREAELHRAFEPHRPLLRRRPPAARRERSLSLARARARGPRDREFERRRRYETWKWFGPTTMPPLIAIAPAKSAKLVVHRLSRCAASCEPRLYECTEAVRLPRDDRGEGHAHRRGDGEHATQLAHGRLPLVRCYVMLCCAMLCCAVLCCAVLCYAVLDAVRCCAIRCDAVLCCAMLCHARPVARGRGPP